MRTFVTLPSHTGLRSRIAVTRVPHLTSLQPYLSPLYHGVLLVGSTENATPAGAKHR